MNTQRIAFFGATGGCAGYCIANALNAGYKCIALVRSQQKLRDSMSEKNVSQQCLKEHLTIVEGDVKDIEAVKKALVLDGSVVDIIISGIGSMPKLQMSIQKPVVLKNPAICEIAGTTILNALTQLQPQQKPMLVNITTTGLTAEGAPSDVPCAFQPLYHWLLKEPHEDKMALETVVAEHYRRNASMIRGFVNIKPSLLMDGESKGLGAIREGVNEHPAVGYTIRRSDVGLWMFEKLVKEDIPQEWLGKGVSITY